MPLTIQGKNFQKIRVLILKSNLSSADQAELIEAFAKANDADLENVLKLFNEDSSWVGRISANYKAKRNAFATGDFAVWQDIIQEEESQLKNLEE